MSPSFISSFLEAKDVPGSPYTERMRSDKTLQWAWALVRPYSWCLWSIAPGALTTPEGLTKQGMHTAQCRHRIFLGMGWNEFTYPLRALHLGQTFHPELSDSMTHIFISFEGHTVFPRTSPGIADAFLLELLELKYFSDSCLKYFSHDWNGA